MPSPSSSPGRFSKAAIARANASQLKAGQSIQFPCVKSRMVLWCKAGTGTVTVNNLACPMEVGRCLFLPWGHQIHYQASADGPFFMSGIHIIPEHDFVPNFSYEVPHSEEHPLARAPFRRDLDIPELAGIKLGFLSASTPLAHLLEYIVGLFVQGPPEEWMARSLARQLLSECLRFEQRSEMYDHGVPPELERVKQYIAFHLHQPLSLRDLVEFSHLSASTVGRMFRQYLHTTPVLWILRMKMERAKMLLSTRHNTVAEVGAQVGIPDPYYFSKCFKKVTRCSPREYQKQAAVWI